MPTYLELPGSQTRNLPDRQQLKPAVNQRPLGKVAENGTLRFPDSKVERHVCRQTCQYPTVGPLCFLLMRLPVIHHRCTAITAQLYIISPRRHLAI